MIKKNKALIPIAIALFRAERIMLDANVITNLVQQFYRFLFHIDLFEVGAYNLFSVFLSYGRLTS